METTKTRDVRGEIRDDEEALALIDHPDSTEEVPTLDFAPYLEGRPGGREAVAAKLREISTTVGFFYLKNHGIPQDLIDGMFAQSRRFHALPEAEKAKLPWHDGPLEKIGYEPFARKRAQAYNTALVTPQKPNLYSQFVYAREDARDPRSKLNEWPANLPGFKETLQSYGRAIEQLGRKFLPLWSISLGLPLDYFDRFFTMPHVQTGMLHYPPQKEVGGRQYGLVPHTDNAMMTFLAQSNVPGLAVRMPSGHWRTVDIVPGTLVVNTGNVIVVWTNEEYLSTKHRVINTNAVDRYSIPVFFGPNDDALIEVVPTCRGPERPVLYEPITYGDMRSWYFGGRKKMA